MELIPGSCMVSSQVHVIFSDTKNQELSLNEVLYLATPAKIVGQAAYDEKWTKYNLWLKNMNLKNENLPKYFMAYKEIHFLPIINIF